MDEFSSNTVLLMTKKTKLWKIIWMSFPGFEFKSHYFTSIRNFDPIVMELYDTLC